jgi:hypothetical protein
MFGYSLIEILRPIAVALVFIALMSLVREPMRQKIMVLGIAGAGAVYISGGGMGAWEFAFTAVLSICAYLGFTSYNFIGLGWLLHTGWDIVHHLSGNPIIPFSATSSLGCAICDPVIAIWCFANAPAMFAMPGRKSGPEIQRVV